MHKSGGMVPPDRMCLEIEEARQIAKSYQSESQQRRTRAADERAAPTKSLDKED